MMETRIQVRRMADKQKREMIDKVERIKKKGRVVRQDLL